MQHKWEGGGPQSEIPLLSSFLYLLGWVECTCHKPHEARCHGVLAPRARAAARAECARTRSCVGPVRPSQFLLGVRLPLPRAVQVEDSPSPPHANRLMQTSQHVFTFSSNE